MFRFCVCILLALSSSVWSEVLGTKNVAIKANAIATPPAEEPQLKDGDDCNSDSYLKIVCQNDRLQFCGPTNKIMSTPCIVNGRQGFCNCEKDECVAERPTCNDEKEKCLTPGVKLPDNLNCHKFSYCNEEKEKITLECPGNLIYNPTLGKCLDQNTSPCNRIVCPKPGNTLQLIPFPQARDYFVLCYQGVGDVRKCPFKNYAVRNNKCQFDCKMQNDSGLFMDTNEERCNQGYYYSCRRAGTNFTTVQAKCPAGKFFNEEIGLCTSENKCSKANNNKPEEKF